MTEANRQKTFTIVGIGASAGGLDACSRFLKALPKDTGMGFILVQHLDPNHESILSYLLSKTAVIPVTEAAHKLEVKPNHLYVIPHNKDMTIKDGVLLLTTRTKNTSIHMPIDRFFMSLAKSQKEMAIGIVLSGTATDGTIGLEAIKANGGLTFAQDNSAKYIGMPESAVASGAVDYILPPEKIADALAGVATHPYVQSSKILYPEHTLPGQEENLREIFYLLRKRFGVDFGLYKPATIKRRMKRRMLLKRISTLEEYITYLQTHSGEVASLYEDFLINVTSFFRDTELFTFLRTSLIPRMVSKKTAKDSIRIWVPGCATGEEVYSIAISLVEFLAGTSTHIPIQLFGSDVSKSSIEKARIGIYSKSEVANVSPKRLENFFSPSDSGYQINKSIRELCVFAVQNVLEDPPFSRLDLISCQNVLIYLDLASQRRVLRTFHYSLKAKGILMLGKSESVVASSDLFPKLDKTHKVYAKNEQAARSIIDLPTLLPTLERQRSALYAVMPDGRSDSFDIQKEADTVLLSQYAPASVIIGSDLDIIQFRGSTSAYLEPPSGKASFNLIKMAKDDLGFELRNAISKVKKTGKPFRKEHVPLKTNGTTSYVTIEIVLLKKNELGSNFLVIFENMSGAHNEPIETPTKVHGSKDRRIAELVLEIAQMREDMRSIAEEQETINEELQTANEELLSGNEELQSVNEELGTSKEELESMNEELATVNEEVQIRNDQLVEAREYAESIIRAVQLPLLILDNELRVKMANNAFLQTFQVSESETIGSMLYHLGNGQWNIPKLRSQLLEILPLRTSFDNYEVEVVFPIIGHKIMLLNARKLLADGEKILLTIEDITDRREAEKQKDLFIGIASHELKTPLTTVKGYAQILEKRLSANGDTKDAYLIKNINKQTDKVTSLIYDLLNTSKIQSGKLVLEKKNFDLDAVLTKCILDFQSMSPTHRISKEGSIEKHVYGDANRIEQVLTNLITNAVKYSPTANKVIVRLMTDKDNAIVSVQDFGIGIAREDTEKIFERFYRTNSKADMNVTGFGLGLYIASEIIKEHNGKIWVESMEGVGSTFYFSLPYAKHV